MERPASPPSAASRPPRGRAGPLIALGVLLVLAVAGLTVSAVLRARLYPIAGLATHAPRRTTLMMQRAKEAADQGRRYRVDQRWIPYDDVSPLLRRAILVAEDNSFFAHGGLDWGEIRESARRNLKAGRIVRGGSTITQQLAKNLFLGDPRTLTRKLTEAFLAVRLERTLSKRRIFELYLNLIEWGDGIYGAEAAARRYFGVGASQLNPREAVLLAAVIINPRRFSVLQPSRRIERRVRLIAGRLRRSGFLSDADYYQVVGEPPHGWFGVGPSPTPPPESVAIAAPAPPAESTGAEAPPVPLPDTLAPPGP